MKKVKNDAVRVKINDLVKIIKMTGHDRYVSRLNKHTKELENIIFEINPFEVTQDELTPAESSQLKKEEKIVLPIIQSRLYDAINLLLNDDTTRQAIVVNMDFKNPVEEFPCLTLFHFLTDEKELNMKVFVRSSDVEHNLFVDCWFLSELLKQTAKNASKKIGRITLFISSAHIYI